MQVLDLPAYIQEKPQTVEQLKSYFKQNWKNFTLKLQLLVSSVSKWVLLKEKVMSHCAKHARIPMFLECVAGIKLRMSAYLQKTLKFISLNFKYLVFRLYSIEYRWEKSCKSLHSVVFYLYATSQHLLELGL